MIVYYTDLTSENKLISSSKKFDHLSPLIIMKVWFLSAMKCFLPHAENLGQGCFYVSYSSFYGFGWWWSHHGIL